MPRIPYPGSVLSRDEAEATFVFRVDATVSDRVDGVMTSEKHLSLIVRQSDSLGRNLGEDELNEISQARSNEYCDDQTILLYCHSFLV